MGHERNSEYTELALQTILETRAQLASPISPLNAQSAMAITEAKVVVTAYRSSALTARLLAGERGMHHPPYDLVDWRMAIDSIMIDPDYDGRVLNVALSDAPRRKRDLVCGSYELPVPKHTVTVAVKITDILGAEILVTRTL